MHDPRTNLSNQVIDEVRKHFPGQTFETVIPRSVRLSEAPSYGKSVVDFDPRSRGAQAYENLALEVVQRGLLS
jgi:chromosome partitioning protein